MQIQFVLLGGYGILVSLMSLHAMVNVRNQGSRFVYAGFWRRAGACLVDIVILWIALKAMSSSAPLSLDINPETAKIILISGTLIPGFIYFSVFEASGYQATPGKMIFRIKVVDMSGRRLGLRRSMLRQAGKVFSLALLGWGFLMAGWSHRKMTLHDQLVGALVISRRL